MSQVRNMRSPFREQILYLTPDNESYELDDRPFRTVMNMGGWGSPPYEIETSRNPYQHGVRVTGVRVIPRNIDITLHHYGTSRDEYWSLRRALQDSLRMSRLDVNNPTVGSLRRVLSTGEVFQLDGLFSSGTGYDNRMNRWNEFSFVETLTFTAYDPIIYDPTSISLSYDGFDASATQTKTITYSGTWQEYPIIVFTGPADDFTITHNDFSYVINYDRAVVGGETITINFQEKTVVSSVDGNVVGYVTQSEGLGKFAFFPDPRVTDGDNEIEFDVTSPTAASQFDITYYKRYEAI